MSGHNKWSKIKNKKAVTDAAKSKIFSKMAKLISTASKEAKGDSAQMIYSMETVRAGARGVWHLHLQGLYKQELFAVLSSLAQASVDRSEIGGDPVLVIPIGGKTAVGWGRVSMRMTSKMRTETIPPEFSESSVALTPDSPNMDTIREAYQARLRANRDEILTILEEASK